MLILRPLIRFADFTGRAQRAEYWLFVLLQGVVVGLCLVSAIGSLGAEDMSRGVGGFLLWLGLAGLASVILFIPYLAVLARRLHDSGRSAWWLLLLTPGYVAPMLSGGALTGTISRAAPRMADPAQVGAAGEIVAALAGVGAILLVASLCSLVLTILTLLPGTRGPNRFGPDPRDPHAVGGGAGGRSIYDEDRLEELFAEARRDGGLEDAGGARPSGAAFDFGPGPQPAPAAAAAPPVDWGRPAWESGVAPSRPFGRRSS